MAPIFQHGIPSSIKIPSGAPLSQETSPLFSLLPAEIRNHIFALALAPYDDPLRVIVPSYEYLRPDHQHPRRSSTALLRTCRRVYIEARWYLWNQSEHVLFLRKDGKFDDQGHDYEAMRQLRSFARSAAAPNQRIEFEQLRMFTRGLNYFCSSRFRQLFIDPAIRPRRVIISMCLTIYSNYWQMTSPSPIHDPQPNDTFLPDSVTELLVQLEALHYDGVQVLLLAKHVVAKWEFVCKGRATRLAVRDTQEDVKLAHWRGVSVSQSKWPPTNRDRTEVLDYAVATVRFTPTGARKTPDTIPDTYATVARGRSW